MSDIAQRSTKEVLLIAEELGVKCVFLGSNELCLDFDEGKIPDSINSKVVEALAKSQIVIIDELLTVSNPARGIITTSDLAGIFRSLPRLLLQLLWAQTRLDAL